MKYTPVEFDNGRDRFAVKNYQVRVITANQFLAENKLSLAKLGVMGDRITEIAVDAKDRDIADQFGVTVYIAPNHHVTAVYRGVYFALRRTKTP